MPVPTRSSDEYHLLHRAILFSERAHRGQLRKGTLDPYFNHPVAVGMLVLAHQHPIGAAVVGLLHDVIEDTPVDSEEISDAFGPEIARAVVDLSEKDKAQPWEERKRAYVAHLARASELALPACAADKVHNLRSILWDLDEARRAGQDPREVWQRFKRPARKIAAYHRAVERALGARGFSGGLMESLDEAIRRFAGSVGADPLDDRFAG
jgi:(p)ppGpp synthase/HD superfamily hydrolase